MTAGAWTPTNAARTDILNALHDFNTDTHKMLLFTSAGTVGVGNTTLAALVAAGGEVSPTNTGYTTGGATLAMTMSGTGTVTVVMTTAPVWTAGSANLTAKWAVIAESGGNVIFFATLDSGGADVTATNGNSLTLGSNGGTIFTLA